MVFLSLIFSSLISSKSLILKNFSNFLIIFSSGIHPLSILFTVETLSLIFSANSFWFKFLFSLSFLTILNQLGTKSNSFSSISTSTGFLIVFEGVISIISFPSFKHLSQTRKTPPSISAFFGLEIIFPQISHSILSTS